ncbi:MAG: hypothetical protein KDD11_02825 [Acidobacteria bacterium]|nr:hypothetical protein [Acidobacteriota bacterium]
MSGERKIYLTVVAVAAVLVAGLLLYPRVQEHFLPKPVAAWVAIQPEGSDVAVIGPVVVEAGTPFTLQAVLEAQDRDGQSVYYTEAPGLRFPDHDVPAAALRRWDRERRPRILWFSVEGGTPYLDVDSIEAVDHFHFEELYRPEWPQAWSIPGSLEPSGSDAKELRSAGVGEAFGTQRYHVRFEIFEDEEALLPDERFKSWGADQVEPRWDTFPVITEHLAGHLGPASEIFGLTQIEPGPEHPELLKPILELMTRRLAFSRVAVLGAVVRAAGTSADALEWRPLGLSAGVPWGDGGVAAGDLIQVLDRVVLLYHDAGEPGVLDPQDLCLDFARGAAVRPLDQVFDTDAEVSWVALGR